MLSYWVCFRITETCVCIGEGYTAHAILILNYNKTSLIRHHYFIRLSISNSNKSYCVPSCGR